MVNRQVSISDAEWTIMKALWQCKDKKMTLKEIAEAVADAGWSYTTVRTMVGRLVEKEAIAADESHPRNFLYSAAVTEEALSTASLTVPRSSWYPHWFPART